MGRTISLRGKAAAAFVRAHVGKAPKNYEEALESVVTAIHLTMSGKKQDVAKAKELLRSFVESQRLRVTEGIESVWHYHLSKLETPTRGLCGASTMPTETKLSDWEVPFGEHFPKKPTWCRACSEARFAGV